MPAPADPSGELPSTTEAQGTELLSTVLGWVTEQLAETLEHSQPADHDGAVAEWGPDAGSSTPAYWDWQRQWHLLDVERIDTAQASGLPTDGPLLSVVVPMFRPSLLCLRESVQSVIGQTYRRWELLLCDDDSEDPELTATIAEVASTDPRITVLALEHSGGISQAANRALADARGEFVVKLDPGDVLTADALAEVAVVATTVDDADVVYWDDDRLDEMDRPCQPHFKPDWDPDLLLSSLYLGNAVAIRHELLRGIGGFRLEFDGGQDFDLVLRATESAREVTHIPKVLCHRAVVDCTDGAHTDAKTPAIAANRRALEDAVARRSVDGVVEVGSFPGSFHLRRRIHGAPTVSVIIPFRDQAALTVACLSSLQEAPGYEISEVVLIDNGSIEPETRVLRRQLEATPATRVIDHPGPFNWSAVNNRAAATCSTDMLLFLNNDIEATSAGWLHALVELGQRPEVGAVGARLLYPDGSVQHAGILLGMQGIVSHIFRGLPRGRSGYLGWDQVVRSYSALTGACMLVRRTVFEEMGGFDEAYPVAFNDIDFCIRLGQDGYRLLYTPHAELTHWESVSRGLSGYSADYTEFLARWGDLIRRDDPHYNRNLGRMQSWCPLRAPGEDEEWLSWIGGLVPMESTGDNEGDSEASPRTGRVTADET